MQPAAGFSTASSNKVTTNFSPALVGEVSYCKFAAVASRTVCHWVHRLSVRCQGWLELEELYRTHRSRRNGVTLSPCRRGNLFLASDLVVY